ncbi:hypothetical protein [Streptomyces sp. NPDC056669]|uniref:hypothetical protein n=1 Tax=Streptomyces sp. NPDC056669 TaxID=3345903 RepID=UPI00368620B7
MTRIVRFADDAGTVRTGVADDTGGVRAFPGAPLIAELLRLPVAELRALVENTVAGPAAVHEPDVLPLPPLDGLMELWAAAGVIRRRGGGVRDGRGHRRVPVARPLTCGVTVEAAHGRVLRVHAVERLLDYAGTLHIWVRISKARSSTRPTTSVSARCAGCAGPSSGPGPGSICCPGG